MFQQDKIAGKVLEQRLFHDPLLFQIDGKRTVIHGIEGMPAQITPAKFWAIIQAGAKPPLAEFCPFLP
jgi:hypothetical protein